MIRSLIKLRPLAWGLLFALTGPAEIVAAQAIPTPPPAPLRYSIRAPDAVLMGAVGVVAALPNILGSRLPYAQCNPCDSTRLWPIDRGTLGLPNAGLSEASTLTMGATVLGAGVVLGLTRRGEPHAGAAAAEDLAVLVEAMEIDQLLTNWGKVLFHRARPVLYSPVSGQHQTVDAGRSFPSGHSSFSFAAAAAAASILHRRGVLGKHKVPVILLFAGAATTAALRVAAHKHFPTDVVAGALLGTTVGWFVPRLHPIR